ncbi:Sacchrp-dh-NADP domain-containing protein [Mycena indigotica]|uniref:Sacchrp-dh-NADP domain-containing protein n=1 Tax=Mycena indigotica TaxID=2126181 RepID=A0A8H6RZV1_9AGAR|nr:Sacchrp-dh-NADP domain-containing protein [Mycena indigotica]KAF7289302.1 Sacchrp-dh-NADP domain-containing protein [Mycena indigotica]
MWAVEPHPNILFPASTGLPRGQDDALYSSLAYPSSSMSSKPVVLLLGATGFTGKLVTRQLAFHRDRDAFALVLGGRSEARLNSLVKELGLDSSIRLQVVDVKNREQLGKVIPAATVVLNTVGPFWLYGSPVVETCLRNCVHYVDLTGETQWIKEIIKTSHYPATKNGTIIVPSCGFDSVPADLLPFIAARKLQEFTGHHVDIDNSISAYSIRGSMSGGTLATLFTVPQIHPTELQAASAPFALSPMVGVAQAPSRLVYRVRMPDTKQMLSGAFFFMSPANRPLQQRSWGLLEAEAARDETDIHFGPQFKYDEFFVTGSRLLGLFVTLTQALVFSLFLIPPTRWLLKQILPQPGDGPSERTLKSGRMKVTNVSTAASGLAVKTVMQSKGDPGYWTTSFIVAEAALSIALHYDELPALARRGGVLTPATAFGDVLAKRLHDAGVLIESQVFKQD